MVESDRNHVAPVRAGSLLTDRRRRPVAVDRANKKSGYSYISVKHEKSVCVFRIRDVVLSLERNFTSTATDYSTVPRLQAKSQYYTSVPRKSVLSMTSRSCHVHSEIIDCVASSVATVRIRAVRFDIISSPFSSPRQTAFISLYSTQQISSSEERHCVPCEVRMQHLYNGHYFI
jgi:hypothetical protein